MSNHKRTVFAATMAAMLFTVAPAFANPQDDAATRNYVLTSDKLQRYASFAAAVKREAGHDAALRAEMASAGDAGGETLSSGLAALRKHPVLLGYVHRAGLADQDVILIPLVIVGATMEQSLPAAQRKTYPISPASYAFVLQHKAEIAAVTKAMH